jgi:hypothetical protein
MRCMSLLPRTTLHSDSEHVLPFFLISPNRLCLAIALSLANSVQHWKYFYSYVVKMTPTVKQPPVRGCTPFELPHERTHPPQSRSGGQ